MEKEKFSHGEDTPPEQPEIELDDEAELELLRTELSNRLRARMIDRMELRLKHRGYLPLDDDPDPS